MRWRIGGRGAACRNAALRERVSDGVSVVAHLRWVVLVAGGGGDVESVVGVLLLL